MTDSTSQARGKSKHWSRDELILAINLYCKIPFGTIHIRNPHIIELASLLGRTPGSISYKLANFASIDPTLDRKGAANTSKLDREVWAEFFENWEEMAFESETQMGKLKKEPSNDTDGNDLSIASQGKEAMRLVKTRVNQNFFRQMVLTSYDNRCCITGLAVPELLVASHIVPWSEDKTNRLNPSNGICLNSLHDKAFDRHLITLSDNYEIIVSRKLKKMKHASQGFSFLINMEGKRIELPKRFLPDLTFVRQHRNSSEI